MRSVVLIAIGALLLLLPGLFLLTVPGSTLSLALGILSVLTVLGSLFFARIPGRKNPLKFVSFVFPVLAILFSKGYIVKYLHFSAGLPSGDIGNVLDLLFFAELGLIAVMSYETANSLKKVAKENGYDEADKFKRVLPSRNAGEVETPKHCQDAKDAESQRQGASRYREKEQAGKEKQKGTDCN